MLQSQSKRDAEVPPSTGRVEEQYLGHQVEVPVHDPQAFTNGKFQNLFFFQSSVGVHRPIDYVASDMGNDNQRDE